jgi:glutathione peroxidase
MAVRPDASLFPPTLCRRSALGLIGAALAGPAAAQTAPASSASRRTAYSFSFPGLHGGTITLADWTGRPILVVNTASFCGFAGQLDTLQRLYAAFRERGLVVLGVPSNDFGGQEPGGPQETADIARGHGVAFPLTAKQRVVGPDAHPFYRWAAAERPRDVPRWNFHKYLVGRDGHVAAVFPTSVDPTDSRIGMAVSRELVE